MSVYNITGWSGGGRRPLTYNLRAGQFRNMGGCNVFGMPTRTVINNNFGGCGYNYDCGCNSGSRVPSWMQWCMGGGMVMNFLGNMMSALFPGKESTGTDGKGATLTEGQLTDLALYKQLAKDNNCTILGPRSDGSYYFKPKGKAAIPLASLDEVKKYIDENFTTEATDDVEPADTATAHKYTKYEAELAILGLKSKYSDKITKGEITFDEKNQEFSFNGKKYTNPNDLEKAIKEYPKPASSNNAATQTQGGTSQTQSDTGNTNNITKTAAELKAKFDDGGIWYNLAKCYTPNASGDTLKAIWRAIKDANDSNAYGSGVQYNSKKIPDNFTIPKTITVDSKTYTLEESKLSRTT